MQKNVPDLTTPVPVGITFTSIPTTITAMQWTGQNIQELWDWMGAGDLYGPLPEEDRRSARPAKLYVAANTAWLDLEVGEWIIKDSLGYYPCKDEVFRKKYRPHQGLSGILRTVPQVTSQVIPGLTDGGSKPGADSSFLLSRHEYAENSFYLDHFTGSLLVSREDLEEAYLQLDAFLYPNPGYAPQIAESTRG